MQEKHQTLFHQEEKNMGYIIAYLLFAVAVDLVLEIVDPQRPRHSNIAIHRRLWNDTLFDCRSSGFSTYAAMPRRIVREPGPASRSFTRK
jgi:hypothetical protein